MTSDEYGALSLPLRETATYWALERGEGFSARWESSERRWKYTLTRAPIYVEILEDGSAALVWVDPRAVKAMATTPRGLRRLLTRMYRENGGE